MQTIYNVKFGDIWRMGNYRLLCGDSTEKSMLDSFLKDYHPKVCITDPPFGINYRSKSKTSELSRVKVKYDHIANWGDAFRSCKSPVLYTWFSFKHFEVVSKSLLESGFTIRQMLVWVKHHFTLQHHFYHLKHEQCVMSILDGLPTKGLWTGDRKQISVWNAPSVKPKNRIHPTEKSSGVYEIPILNHSL